MPISSSKSAHKVDVKVTDGGTLFVFTALTKQAEDWIQSNVSEEGFNPQLPHVVYCEHRYARALAEGMIQSGLRLAIRWRIDRAKRPI